MAKPGCGNTCPQPYPEDDGGHDRRKTKAGRSNRMSKSLLPQSNFLNARSISATPEFIQASLAGYSTCRLQRTMIASGGVLPRMRSLALSAIIMVEALRFAEI